MGFLGTHGFFLAFLPLLFFAPRQAHAGTDVEISLVAVLALGVCTSSALKDYIGSSRPLTSLGVRRVSRCSSTSREFGLPSTHSANAMSVSTLVLLVSGGPSRGIHPAIAAGLAVYPVLMGCSRVLSGMHSWIDVWAGWGLGFAIAAGWYCVWFVAGGAGWWLLRAGPTGVAAVMALVPLLVGMHPDPEEECPCFEDSVAFVSVFAGLLVGHWMRNGVFWNDFMGVSSDVERWMNVDELSAMAWFALFALRLVIGALSIYAFRKATKTYLNFVLEFTFGPSAVSKPQIQKAASHEHHHIPRFTRKMNVDICVYFGIAVVAVDWVPRLFELLSI
ncbi:PAP2 superfamily-domain-containing protein [Chytriomyces sp. MP71]|nr:PAP2 superfamily-domain-containing protein [Chytriomyces sp. MP71]